MVGCWVIWGIKCLWLWCCEGFMVMAWLLFLLCSCAWVKVALEDMSWITIGGEGMVEVLDLCLEKFWSAALGECAIVE